MKASYGGQYQPVVAALESGGFVVTWYNDNTGVSGSSYSDIYMREYQADGAGGTGSPVNSPSSSTTSPSRPLPTSAATTSWWCGAPTVRTVPCPGVYQQLYGTALRTGPPVGAEPG